MYSSLKKTNIAKKCNWNKKYHVMSADIYKMFVPCTWVKPNSEVSFNEMYSATLSKTSFALDETYSLNRILKTILFCHMMNNQNVIILFQRTLYNLKFFLKRDWEEAN